MRERGNGLSLYSIGEEGGNSTVALLTSQIPSHHHYLSASNVPATLTDPTKGFWAIASVSGVPQNVYGSPVNATAAVAVGPTGSGFAHENKQPYLVLTYIIALQGVYPPRP